MLTAILILLIVTVAAAALHYYFVHSKTSPIPYQNETITLRTEQSEAERKELSEAQNIINAIRNRRESLHERKCSFEDESGEFAHLKNGKLSRALSCDSFDDNSDDDETVNTSASFIPPEMSDIREWIKNPTDFFRLRRESEAMGPDERPWQPNESITDFPVTQPQIMISMSYLPTAERLSVVIVRTRLPISFQSSLNNVFVKSYLLDDRTGKRSNKKKTGMRPLEASSRGYLTSTFNELMIFKLPIHLLSLTTVRVTCFGYRDSDGTNEGSIIPTATGGGGTLLDPHYQQNVSVKRRSSFSHRKEFVPAVSLGFVELGFSSTIPSAVTQFTTMMTNMRKPITCWHQLQPPKVRKRKSFAESSPSGRRYSYTVRDSHSMSAYSAPAPAVPVLHLPDPLFSRTCDPYANTLPNNQQTYPLVAKEQLPVYNFHAEHC